MSTIVYLDCPTGIAGDMCLGALVDAGVPLQYLIDRLRGLGLEAEYRLSSESVRRQGQQATKVHVLLQESAGHHHRHLPDIETLIRQGNLPEQVVHWSLAVFNQLAIAEGAVHGIPPEKVHFHEVGATDAIVDIVGTCLGFHWLEVEEIYCSPLPKGSGTVNASHGRLPVPVPAVLKLWESRQVPVYDNGIEKELVTPTGAAIATTLAKEFGDFPPMRISKVGWGAGTAQLSLPNVLRLWLGLAENHTADDTLLETIAVLETQIDDLSPQAIAYTGEALLAAGALDVFTQSLTMKKSRSGILITVICTPQDISKCEEILFRETTTLGIRRRLQQRSILRREIQTVQTSLGAVRVKVAYCKTPRRVANVQPEYEDCARLARQHQQPWQVVQQLARDAWYQEQK